MASGSSGTPASELEKIGTVISRSLAFLSLQNSPVKDGSLVERADFLSGLGIPFADAAKMLGSTAESLRVMSYKKTKKPKGAARGPKIKVKHRTG